MVWIIALLIGLAVDLASGKLLLSRPYEVRTSNQSFPVTGIFENNTFFTLAVLGPRSHQRRNSFKAISPPSA